MGGDGHAHSELHEGHVLYHKLFETGAIHWQAVVEKNNGTSDQWRWSECTQVWENCFSLVDIPRNLLIAFDLGFFTVIRFITCLLRRVKDFLQIKGTWEFFLQSLEQLSNGFCETKAKVVASRRPITTQIVNAMSQSEHATGSYRMKSLV